MKKKKTKQNKKTKSKKRKQQKVTQRVNNNNNKSKKKRGGAALNRMDRMDKRINEEKLLRAYSLDGNVTEELTEEEKAMLRLFRGMMTPTHDDPNKERMYNLLYGRNRVFRPVGTDITNKGFKQLALLAEKTLVLRSGQQNNIYNRSLINELPLPGDIIDRNICQVNLFDKKKNWRERLSVHLSSYWN